MANSESALNSLVKCTSSKIPKKLIINPLKLRDLDVPKRYKIGDRSIVQNEYIVCIGTISKRKSSLKIIQAFNCAVNEIKSKTNNDKHIHIPKLLFVGRNDLGHKFINHIRNLEMVDYIGSLTHEETLKIIKLSFGTINASTSEGIPRSCLESFSKKACLLPACVPEFKNYCPDICVSVSSKKDYLNFVELIKTMIENRDYILKNNKNYPINNHNYSNFESELLNFYEIALGQKD